VKIERISREVMPSEQPVKTEKTFYAEKVMKEDAGEKMDVDEEHNQPKDEAIQMKFGSILEFD
jgi:hypothetical protein